MIELGANGRHWRVLLAVRLAREHGHDDIAARIEDHKMSVEDAEDELVIRLARERGHDDIVELVEIDEMFAEDAEVELAARERAAGRAP